MNFKGIDKKGKYFADFFLAFTLLFSGTSILMTIISSAYYFGVDPSVIFEVQTLSTLFIVGVIFFVAGIIDMDVITIKRKVGCYKK